MSILKKIEIKGLWGTTDIEWELDPHVNILGGINGSGKSTILNVIGCLSSSDKEIEKYTNLFLETHFYTREEYFFLKNVKTIKEKYFIQKRKVFDNKKITGYGDFTQEPFGALLFRTRYDSKELTIIKYTWQNWQNSIKLGFISTFEQSLADVNAVKKVYGEEVETNLDFELAKLSKDYTNYRLNLSQKIQAVLDVDSEKTNYKELHEETYRFKKRFEEIVNLLFVETNKQLIYENETNKLLFLKDNEKVTVYQLSSGEKQLLIILLTVLIQDNKESVILMDEPEVSLHIDWQKKLIGYIRELNPNAQLIIVTHSPGLIMEKWIDNVTEISEISKPTKGE